MNHNIVIIILTVIALMLCALILLLVIGKVKVTQLDKNAVAKNGKPKRIYNFIPLLVVALISVVILSVNYLSEKQYNSKLEAYKYLQSQLQIFEANSDSLLLNTDDTQKIIDTLNQINMELRAIEVDLKSQEQILGNRQVEMVEINKTIQEAEQKVTEVKKYNKTISRRDFVTNKEVPIKSANNKVMPNKNMKVHNGEYITYSFIINQEIKDEIYAINVTITDEIEQGDTLLFSQYYEPQVGENKFILKNYFKEAKNAKFDMGFIYKKDMKDRKALQ